MKTRLLGMLAVILIAASCGTNKGFHKKHHQSRKWIKVGEKTNPDFAAKDAIKNESLVTTDEKVEQKGINEEITAIEENVVEVALVEEQLINSNNLVDSEETVKEELDAKPTLKEKLSDSKLVKNLKDKGPLALMPTEAKLVKNQIAKVKELKNEKGSGSNGDLVMLALVILCIILAFTLIDNLLGGWLGRIIFTFLVILLILFLLRYFGIL